MSHLQFNILLTICSLIIYFFYFSRFLHMFQLEGYKSKGYMEWITKNVKQFYLLIAVSFSFLTISIISFNINSNTIIPGLVLFILMLAMYIYDILEYRKQSFKKPLVYTWRARRIFITGYLVFILEIFLIFILSKYINFNYWLLLPLLLNCSVALDNILISNFILKPIEKMCGYRFIKEAKEIISSRNDLIVIGITGSYGKTSTKFILQTILSEKYNTYATPDSYNTTFGNVKVIREQLYNLHEIYISEMGARNIGDIAEICNIVKPKYGIITSIGNQHLSTFKTIDNIVKTKYELIQSLPIDGIAFFADDDSYCKKLYDDEKRTKILFGSETSDVYAKDISINEYGSSFTVISNIDNTEFKCNTKLLGQHNIQNILGCIAIAKKLNLTNDEIARGVSKIKSIPHRLELISNSNGLTVIDDAFNSNPWGAKAAIDVLKNFKGRRIIITPGMIELGDEQYKANYNLGKEIGKNLDIAILVGKNITKPIFEGIKSTKFSKENIHIVSSLDEATKLLTKIGKIGDTVLFENDLPDNFNE